LTNIDVNLEDGDKAFYKLLENFKDALFYGKEDTITLDGVQSTLRTKELAKFRDMKVDDSGEGLNISRGRSESHGRGKGRSIGPSIGQRIVVTTQSSNVTIATSQVTSRKTARREGGGGSSSAQVAVSEEEGYESVVV
jgi:hypothetical protein